MSSELELKRQIHNLQQRQSRMIAKQKDPDGYVLKNRLRNTTYWANLDPVKKAAKIARQTKRNQAHRLDINAYQRKYYQKNKDEILEGKRLLRIKNRDELNAQARAGYQRNRLKILERFKQKRIDHGDEIRAVQRKLYRDRKK